MRECRAILPDGNYAKIMLFEKIANKSKKYIFFLN